MKSAGQMILVAVLLAGASAHAGEVVASDKPYAAMVARNIFNLVPIPPNTAPEPPPADPPPKIKPNGIMSIFGKLQVLFKVAPQNHPGQPPAKEEAYVLSEGERQDEIEVTKIDEPGSMVTFNNHGIVQELPLANAPNASGPAPSGGGAGVVPGLAPTRGMLPGGAGVGASRFGQGRNLPGGNPSAGGNPEASAMPSVGGAVSGGIYNPPPQENLSPEAQTLLIEKNYLDAKAKNDPTAPLFPVTSLRQQSDAETGGPLVPGQ